MHRNPDPLEVGDFWMDFSHIGLARGQEVKDTLPASQVYDVQLSELRERPIDVLRGMYEHFQIGFDDELAATLEGAVAAQHSFGKHQYGLEDYGLSEEAIRRRFGPSSK